MALAFPVPAVPASPTPASSRPELRLIEGGRSAHRPRRAVGPSAEVYRRRRLLVVAVAVLVVAAGASFVSSIVGGGAAPADSSYLVAAGQSLWEVAGEVSPGANRLEVVSLLAEANGGTTVVQAGQRLVVPGEVLTLAG